MTDPVRPYGPGAWLIEHPDPAALAEAVRRRGGRDVVDVVPAAATTLVVAAPHTDVVAIEAWLAEVAHAVDAVTEGTLPDPLEIPVVYDGEDLATVAEAVGMTVADVVARHAAGEYRCAFCGFAPGFGYLTGLDPALHLARRETPRPRVPAGSVAIAAGYSAVYPSPSPGGWHLLGRTDVELWEVDRDPPALVTPGIPVRFVEVRR